MTFFYTEPSGFVDFTGTIVTGVVTSLIISAILVCYNLFTKGLSNHSGAAGRLYRRYIRIISRLFKKKNPTKPFGAKGYEYKMYKVGDHVESYMSEITRLDETHFNFVQGEINRVIGEDDFITSYFKGYIKNDDRNYLVWEESYEKDKNNVHITGHYKIPKNDEDDFPGICIEEKGGVITKSFSILSFKESFLYSSLQKLLRDEGHYEKYTSQFGINYNDIDANSEENTFIRMK